MGWHRNKTQKRASKPIKFDLRGFLEGERTVEALMLDILSHCCDLLVEEQVRDVWNGSLGGIWCTGCQTVHGRSGDAIFPLYYLYSISKEEKYRDAARSLLRYIIAAQGEDGAWRNEPEADWKGTTVFQLLALCHACDQLTDQEDGEALKPVIAKAAAWVSATFGEGGDTNINYYLSSALALLLSDRILGKPEYGGQAKRLMHGCIDTRLSRDGWLFGEKTRMRPFTQMTCTVDVGYNLDMSLGVMAEYAKLTGDPKVMSAVLLALAKHMEMVYPDGSIDNSFGSRNYKWTLFGSKTAHGSQMAFMLLADKNAAFYRAARLHTNYLASCIRPDGRFGYGPMHEQLFEQGCIHPSINRADALAVALAYGAEFGQREQEEWDDTRNQVQLPSEILFGAKSYKELAVHQLRSHNWMATISCSGVRNAPTGGTVGYLWHKAVGAVQLGGMTVYRQYEAFNMPKALPGMEEPIAPRIEVSREGRLYSNLYEHDAYADAAAVNNADSREYGAAGALAVVHGKLKAMDEGNCYDCAAFYRIDYEMDGDDFIKRYEIDVRLACDNIAIVEPIVTARAAVAQAGGRIQVEVLHQRQLMLTMSDDSFVLDRGSLARRTVSIFPSVTTVPLRWNTGKVASGIYQFQIRMRIK
ncbi:hypothetical protein B1748_21470 [Paenibacillus sp. MY03]|uniref:hypothetical protein n=1 Tax=Paenibacillus sp. MY03 TaxID=302980 RepID=UPI000B3C6BE0|nr:hypothetical protein [Paenibacillus sp. MY03]OUS74394.1 hypothetical protein B1748_21470 [Paenibacillus sp. MY03]